MRCSEGGSVGQKALSAIDVDHDVEPVRMPLQVEEQQQSENFHFLRIILIDIILTAIV